MPLTCNFLSATPIQARPHCALNPSSISVCSLEGLWDDEVRLEHKILKLEAPRSPRERVTWALALGGRGHYEAIVIPFGFAQDKLVEGSAVGELNVLHLLPQKRSRWWLKNSLPLSGWISSAGKGTRARMRERLRKPFNRAAVSNLTCRQYTLSLHDLTIFFCQGFKFFRVGVSGNCQAC